jgi:hypothetical protein
MEAQRMRSIQIAKQKSAEWESKRESDREYMLKRLREFDDDDEKVRSEEDFYRDR